MDELLTILFRPENAIFVVPAVVATLFMGMSIVGAGVDSLHDHDAPGGLDGAAVGDQGVDAGDMPAHDHDFGEGDAGDADADAGGGPDADHDVADVHAHDHDHGFDHAHLHGGHDHGHAHPHGHGPLTTIMIWFNVGRAPFMVVLEILLLALGFFGVLGTWALHRWGSLGGWSATALTFPAALVAAALTAKGASGLFARFLPTFETKRVTSRSLVGLTAEVASEEINATSGRASATDAAGDLYTVFCKMVPGSPPAKHGEKVVLVAYAPDVDRYTVKPAAATPGGAPPPATKP